VIKRRRRLFDVVREVKHGDSRLYTACIITASRDDLSQRILACQRAGESLGLTFPSGVVGNARGNIQAHDNV
jgi:hypothetical protein